MSADDVAAMSTAMTVGRRAAAGTASRWLEGGGPGRAGAGLSSGGRGGRGGGGREGSVKRVGGPRFRKEAQDKVICPKIDKSSHSRDRPYNDLFILNAQCCNDESTTHLPTISIPLKKCNPEAGWAGDTVGGGKTSNQITRS